MDKDEIKAIFINAGWRQLGAAANNELVINIEDRICSVLIRFRLRSSASVLFDWVTSNIELNNIELYVAGTKDKSVTGVFSDNLEVEGDKWIEDGVMFGSMPPERIVSAERHIYSTIMKYDLDDENLKLFFDHPIVVADTLMGQERYIAYLALKKREKVLSDNLALYDTGDSPFVPAFEREVIIRALTLCRDEKLYSKVCSRHF